MRSINQRGSVLIMVIIAIVMMSVLGLGIYTLTSSSSLSELLSGNDYEAYQLAKAGMRFAINQLNINPNYAGGTYLVPDANNTFTVAVANNVITVTGTTKQGLINFLTANRTLAYNYSWAANAGTISFAGNMPGFTSPNNGSSTGNSANAAAAIVANAGTNTVALGGNVTDSYGTLLFKGSSNNGNCVNGSCNFSNGIRAFFNFTFATQDTSTNSTSGADGFTFAVISAITNTSDRTGGAPAGYSMGELMGYAGPGNTSDGLGLKPPKMALTFDTYPNGNAGICSSGSRNDPSPFSNNVTFMYWGSKSPTTTTCTYGSTPYPGASFDDNVHGAGGSSGDPQNPTGWDYAGPRTTCASGGGSCNWMEDGHTYSARIEIMPTTTPYTYSLKAWIVLQDDPSIFTTTTWWSDFQNVILPYTDTTPQISKTVTFTSADYNNFQQVYFGFTEATGAATQLATLSGLNVFFPASSTGHGTQTITPNPITFTPTTLTVGGTATASTETSSSGLPVTLSSLTPSICTVSGSTVTAISASSTPPCKIAANQAGDAYYYPAPQVTGTIPVGKANQMITLNAGTPLAYNTSETLSISGALGTGAVTYSLTSGSCTLSGTTLTATSGTGSCVVSATIATDANYNSATATATVNLSKANQTITLNAGTPLVYNNSETISATGGSGTGAVTYSLTSGSCTLSGTTLKATSGTGSCVVSATMAADTNYNSATATATVALNMASQATLTLNAGTPLVYNNSETISATGGSGTGAVTYSLTSGSCTLSGTTLKATSGTGSCVVSATKASDGNYNSATATATVALNMASQATLTVVYSSPLTYGNSETLSTTGGSGTGAITYNLLAGGCTLSGTTLTATSGSGTCVVNATKATDGNYLPATSANATVNLQPASQTIGAITFNPTTLTIGGTTTASATATSGLAVTFTSTTTSICTVSGTNGSTVTAVAAGTCTIAANQAGNANYNAATQVTGSITVNKLSQTIGAITFNPTTLTVGGTTTASATASSGLAVTFTSLTTGVCTASGTNGSTITGVTAGTCTIAANQAGNATYSAATQVTANITVTCSGYRVWNNYGSARPFSVGGTCRGNISNGSEITTSTIQLTSGGTVVRYSSTDTTCTATGRPYITYAQAVAADTNGNCQVNYNSGDTVGDR